MNYSLADQRRYAEHQRQLAEQSVGRTLPDCANELLAGAEANPYGEVARIFAPERGVQLAKLRVPDASQFERESERMIGHLESDDTTPGNSYLEDACKLLPSGPRSDINEFLGP